MAKLEYVPLPKGLLLKRWQTPKDIAEQTKEAVAYIRETGRILNSVKYLYTDSLYMNSEEKGINLIEKYHSRAQKHRKELVSILSKEAVGFTYSIINWSELIQTQEDYWYTRKKLIYNYRIRPNFRKIIQEENFQRKGIIDIDLRVIKNSKHKVLGSYPATSDMFLLEEIGVLSGLAKSYFKTDRLDFNKNIVIAYPRSFPKSLEMLHSLRIRIYKGPSLRDRTSPSEASWLDTSLKENLIETFFYNYTPHPNAIKLSL